MSSWLVLFRAEFLRVLLALPFVLVLHGLMICVRTDRGIDLSARLANLVEWGTWAVAGYIVVSSLWMDSPSRRERFLAVRPVRPLALYSAKFAALFLLAGFPFVAVEFANLAVWGWSGSSILLGTLQMALVMLAALLAAFPLVWLWRGKVSGAIGTVLMLVIAWRTMSWIAKDQYIRHDGTLWSTGAIQHPPVLLLMIGVIALLLAGLIAIRGRFRHHVKTLLFLPATSLGVLAAAWVCTPRPSEDRGEPVPLVHLYFGSHPLGDNIHVTLPAPAAPRDAEVEWSFSKLIANGKDFTPWRLQGFGAGDHYGLDCPAVQKVLRARFGNGLKLPAVEASEKSWPNRTLIGARKAGEKLDLDLTARRTQVGFEVVGELPLRRGASLRRGDLLWSIESREPGDHWDWWDDSHLRLTLRCPFLWLGGLQAEEDATYRFFLIREGGEIQKPGSWWRAPASPRGKGSLRECMLSLQEVGIKKEGDWPSGARLAIVRCVAVSQESYSWKSPAPLAVVERPTRDQELQRDPGPDAALAWLKDHPAPSDTATADEVSAWLSTLLPLIPPHEPRGENFQVYVDAIGKVAAAHPDRVLRAIKAMPDSSNTPQYAGYAALDHSLRRDAVQRFPELLEDPVLRQSYARKGWAADVVPYLARKARLNLEFDAIGVLVQAPGAAGFSEAEWLALFRIYPEGYVFRALNGKFVRKELLEEEADRLLDGFIMPQPGRHAAQFPRPINLALARGRVDAPVWLATWIPLWRAQGANNPRGVHVTLATYFELPAIANTDQAAIDWFVAQNPAFFHFDAASGKYQLP